MPRFVVNTSFHLPASLESRFVSWAKSEFIPSALASGLFAAPSLFRLHVEVEPSAVSFAIHLETSDNSRAQQWFAMTASPLIERLRQAMNGQMVFFTTSMEEI